jgi:hypothetical protein
MRFFAPCDRGARTFCARIAKLWQATDGRKEHSFGPSAKNKLEPWNPGSTQANGPNAFRRGAFNSLKANSDDNQKLVRMNRYEFRVVEMIGVSRQ